jgi:outer membrane receptor protein involved in Fe transport
VTLRSPALQLPQVEAVTDGEGRYRFADLPAGVFVLRYELSGFQTLIRDNLEISAGFAARVDVVLKLGGVAETVTVSGASPVVDVSTTSAGATLSTEMVNKTIPGSRMFSDIARMVPGISNTQAPNIGLLGLASLGGFKAYGAGGFQAMIDGVDVRSNTYPNAATAAEIDVRTFGNSADVSTSGALINIVTKSGGNEFHGRYADMAMGDTLQGDNITDALRAQGITVGDATKYFNDLDTDLGGRFVRDKLWFYTAYRDRRNKRSAVGFALDAGPDGRYGSGDEPPYFPTVATQNWTSKMSYQATRNYQFVGFYARDLSVADGVLGTSRGATRFIPYESATISRFNPTNWRGEIKATPASNLLFNAQIGRVWYVADYQGTGFEDIPARFDRETQIFTGGSISAGGNYGETIRPRIRWMSQGNVTYLPAFLASRHELKTGYRTYIQEGASNAPNHASGNYMLVYDKAGGLSHQPVEIQAYNFPVDGSNRENSIAIYVNDKWQVNDRLTLNVGLRYDYDHAFVPEQTKRQGQFGTSGTFPMVDANRFYDAAPRLAFAFDLAGDGKTVWKTTWGKFNAEIADSFASPYNVNAITTTTYRWHDLNGNSNYDPGEVNLDLNGADFISVSSAATNIQNLDLRRPTDYETTTSIAHEVRSKMSVRAAWINKRITLDTATVNVKRPFSAYDIALSRRDPGPDGVLSTPDDGGGVTIYDYNAAYRGAAFVANQIQNRPDGRADTYNTIEVSMNQRSTGTWGLVSSYAATKNHRWLTVIPTSPNDEYFPLDETWEWTYKVNGSYRFPGGFQFAGIFDVQNGTPGQRTYTFRATDPDGGTPLRQLSTVTLRLEPYGAHTGPVRSEANLRLSKFFRLPKGELKLDVDIFNAFNSSAVWATDYVSGPTFGYATTIVGPRVFQFGASYEF